MQSEGVLSPPKDWMARFTADLRLPVLTVSYSPRRDGSRSPWAERLGLDDHVVLTRVKEDLRQGVTLIEGKPRSSDDAYTLGLRGFAWEVWLTTKSGETTGRPLGFVTGINQLKYPNKDLGVKLAGITFEPVWDEPRLDLEQLKSDYEAMVRDTKQAQARLNSPREDHSLKQHRYLHGVARKQYSALRTMMGLLQLKTEQEQRSFAASVLAPDETSPEHTELDAPLDAPLVILLMDKVSPDQFDEGARVELSDGSERRPWRTTITSVKEGHGEVRLLLDIAADRFEPGSEVSITLVSRFAMRAHQRALEDFLRENVNGYWPNLARLLCTPDAIAPTPPNATVDRFFCDQREGAPRLNERQREAVIGAVNAPSAFCIQGPPGTGKTTVICELVQHLAARGERILMVAPTHVAIDEVLRRVGTTAGIRAVRLSWDDSRIDEAVRHFAPGSMANPLFDALRAPNAAKLECWRQEQASLQSLEALFNKYLEALREEDTARQHWSSSQHARIVFEKVYPKKQAHLLSQLAAADGNIPALRAGYQEATHEHAAASAAFNEQQSTAGRKSKLLSFIGMGPVGSAKKRLKRALRAQRSAEQDLAEMTATSEASSSALAALSAERAELTERENHARQAYSEVVTERAQTETDINEQAEMDSIVLNEASARAEIKRIKERGRRLPFYANLSDTFCGMLSDGESGDLTREAIQNDVVGSANLFCCTTTGVAGSPELRDNTFDTLILDEASRVTDAEFLIAANKAKRWILVGDEHQLPPYVEQGDEHFIHALSALYRAEASGQDLRPTIDELGKLWLEDEEQHKFRNDSVERTAVDLQQTGQWESVFRQEFTEAYRWLEKESEDPTRALLAAMRTSIVRSLFERVVASCPDNAKVRLCEQRRMISPIARIVSEPVYGGDYISPSDEALAVTGVTPLTTATFPAPITFLDTSYLGRRGSEALLRNSFINQAEADHIVRACLVLEKEVVLSGAGKLTVSILAFYKAQARLIKDEFSKHRFAKLQFAVIDAIDRIQGQESDVVFISFTRTKYAKHVNPGFGQWLQDVRRLNVACTRAHRALFLVGQRELLGKLCANDDAMAFYANLDALFANHPDDMRVVKHWDTTP